MRCPVILATALALSGLFPTAGAATEPTVPQPADGDLHYACDAQTPGPHQLWLRYGFARGASNRWGTLQTSTLTLLYGLRPNLAVGLSGRFHAESSDLGTEALTKSGPGDTRLLLKWRVPLGDEATPWRLALRPALRLPTGYDRDAEQLVPFTTRTVDFEALASFGLEGDQVDLMLSPGLLLPGEEANSLLLAGAAVRIHHGLPWGLGLAAEYFLRHDLVTEERTHSVFSALAVPLPMDFTAEIGLRKDLLEQESSDPEIHLRIGRGWYPRGPRSVGFAAHATAPRLAIAPVRCAVPDPHGLSQHTHNALLPMLARDGRLRAPETESELGVSIEILSILEGTGRGLSIPKILATPHATLDVLARVALRVPPDGPIVAERPLQVHLRRGTGMILIPSGQDEDAWVPSAQVRRALRERAARQLAERAHREIRAALDGMARR